MGQYDITMDSLKYLPSDSKAPLSGDSTSFLSPNNEV